MPLMDNITAYLQALKLQQNEMKLFLGKGYNENDFICKRDDGTPLNPDYVTHKFNSLLKDNNLPHIRFHDLRHSSASLLINMGFTLKEVQEWLGHANMASTSIYAHLEYKSKERMADKISEKLNILKAV